MRTKQISSDFCKSIFKVPHHQKLALKMCLQPLEAGVGIFFSSLGLTTATNETIFTNLCEFFSYANIQGGKKT